MKICIQLDTLEILDHLTDEQAGQLLKAINAYHRGREYEIPGLLKVAFAPLEAQFIKDQKKYDRICERNRLNGEKGGRPKTKKTQSVKKKTQNNPNNPVGSVPYKKIVELYHESLPTLPKIEKLTKTRETQIRILWNDDLPALTNWENFFDYVSQSNFLMGKVPPINGGRSFRANLEWLTKQANYVKVLEGNYHGV